MNNITTTNEEKDGVITLIRNGKAAICPFRTPIVLPSQLQGQLQIMPHSCNSQCPHFNLREIEGMTTTPSYELELTCGNGAFFQIYKDQPSDQPTEPAKKIIL